MRQVLKIFGDLSILTPQEPWDHESGLQACKEEAMNNGDSKITLVILDLKSIKADKHTLYLFEKYMLAKRLKRTVPKFLRDQLMLTMHYNHGY